MDEQNTHKVAIVTGGASGIGFAIAERFVENGLRTVIAGRDENKLNAAKEKLGELCYPIRCDLNNLSEIPNLVDIVTNRFGQIDILVNNAGINMKKEFIDVTNQ